MEFKAEKVGKNVIVKALVEKKPNGDVTVKVPSFILIKKLMDEHGKRDIQQVQSEPNEQRSRP